MSVSGKESVPPGETIPGGSCRVLETLGFEGKYPADKSGPCFKHTRVSDFTLCPLGQSKKAIGHESQIGPCVATHKWITVRLDVSETNGAVANKGMEPQGRRRIPSFRVTKRSTKRCRLSKTTRSRVHVQTVGLECRDKKVSAPSRRRRMSLDIPSLQKLLHVCASVIWRPSLVALFLRNSICCRRYLCS